jgi:hypothetical protein
MRPLRLLCVLIFGEICSVIAASTLPPFRPFIWVTPADRPAILEKIETQPWARAAFEAMRLRVAAAVAEHREDPAAFLAGLPLIESSTDPKAHPTLALIRRNMASIPAAERRNSLQRYLLIGIDCGVLYYLTDEENYAQCAADILHTVVEAMVQMSPHDQDGNSGLIYPNDHLYEARALGAQVPILYDFVANFLQSGAPVYDVKRSTPVAFNFDHAQAVFRQYADLAINRGIIDCNWPVLEMSSLAHNALAIDDPAERAELLTYVTHVDTPHQDSLAKVMAEFERAGDVWPESFQYSGGVASISTYMVALLLRQDASITLPADFARIPNSISRINDFRFPNDDMIRFGDGPRRKSEDFDAYELAYLIGLRTDNSELMRKFGGLLSAGLESGRYRRMSPSNYNLGAHPYFEPLNLLWFAPEVHGTAPDLTLPTTDALPFVGALIQRNLSPDGDPSHGLMSVVLGGHHVHGHASGMSLELYGAGYVLGTPSGKGTYRTDEHENYRRLFASYNSVIVNGASRSKGGWVDLGINTVAPVALEPALGAAPVSPHHSFTLTSFRDDRGPGAKANQERLVGLVRTSDSTGFYVDVFRSVSELPSQFHDYLFHHVGDDLDLQAEHHTLPLRDTPDRFLPVAGAVWNSNQDYLFPGWHFFKNIRTSAPTSLDVMAEFVATKLKPDPVHMRLYIAGETDREYTSVFAPETKEAPDAYAKKSTPTLVMRQTGEAWHRPFAVVYEPFAGSANDGSIQTVTTIRDRTGVFSGFKVTSRVADHRITQIVLVQPTPSRLFTDESLGVTFRGRYAVITLDDQDQCTHLYLGEGSLLRYGQVELTTTSGAPSAASVDLSSPSPRITARTEVKLLLPDAPPITAPPTL